MKAYYGSGGIAPRFLSSTLHGGERSDSRPGRFNPRERAPGTHWIGGMDMVSHSVFHSYCDFPV
jgi:hypothetical protein